MVEVEEADGVATMPAGETATVARSALMRSAGLFCFETTAFFSTLGFVLTT